MMDRRAFVSGALAVLAAPLAVDAQQAARVARVGFLAMGRHPAFPVFAQALTGLGWIEGLAADLVRRGVDVIVALIHPEIVAAQRATKTIPPSGAQRDVGCIFTPSRSALQPTWTRLSRRCGICARMPSSSSGARCYWEVGTGLR